MHHSYNSEGLSQFLTVLEIFAVDTLFFKGRFSACRADACLHIDVSLSSPQVLFGIGAYPDLTLMTVFDCFVFCRVKDQIQGLAYTGTQYST